MILIEIINLKWEPGREVLKGGTKRQHELFERYMARKYVEIIKRAVGDQRYGKRWAPLSPKYLGFKRRIGWSLKTWEATGELIKDLRVKDNGNVGFDNRRKHKRSRTKYLKIARSLEYGTMTIPARPLFRSSYWYMKKNVRYFYNRWKAGKP